MGNLDDMLMTSINRKNLNNLFYVSRNVKQRHSSTKNTLHKIRVTQIYEGIDVGYLFQIKLRTFFVRKRTILVITVRRMELWGPIARIAEEL